MTQEELAAWAGRNGWREIGGHWSLAKPSLAKPGKPGKPADAIVRLVMKATVVNVEIRKPAGKWEKVSGAAYGTVQEDPDTGVPRGLGLVSIPGFTRLMQDNKDAQVFG